MSNRKRFKVQKINEQKLKQQKQPKNQKMTHNYIKKNWKYFKVRFKIYMFKDQVLEFRRKI